MVDVKASVKGYGAARAGVSWIPVVARAGAAGGGRERAITGCTAVGVSFLKRGIGSTEMLKDLVIRPLMPNADCDVGWVPSGLEQRVGVPRRDRHYKDHNYARSALCGLVMWNPVKDDVWELTDYDKCPLTPGCSSFSKSHNRDLKDARMQLITLLRHSVPKPWQA